MSQSSAFYQGKLWILGGYGQAGTPVDDIWTSFDGATWTLQAEHAPWGPRDFSVALVFQDKLWLIDGDSRMGDVWSLSKE